MIWFTFPPNVITYVMSDKLDVVKLVALKEDAFSFYCAIDYLLEANHSEPLQARRAFRYIC